ncbi:glycoside hydrolase family 10 protein [Dyadobacter luteus]|uniref:glycoside hydrolase family 10 protein n=1 Tax=Dyadobacter luteus TaxID=2259619 RepID=UPI0018F2E656|nr:family 10 glycosylhydrolase [Dyadobacter luteus]
MKKIRVITLFLLLDFFLLTGCVAQSTETEIPLPPKREFRAVWIATVDNIDWPSSKTMPPSEQRSEFSTLLDFHKRVGMNAVFVQVRAAGDAFYAKSSEPWSEWLTGKQGRRPEPFWDPLDFMIKEAHQRGLEFHAWLNLNRLVHKSSTSVSTDNLSYTHPEWIINYDGYKLFDFGIPEVRDFITQVTVNVAKNYDVDGIHFDDYFYPYVVPGQVVQDDATFRKYGKEFASKADWRRNNINLLVKQIHDALQEVNPRLKFGISPCGVWRNKGTDPEGSKTYGALASYDDLFADSRKWIKEGWVDYIAPQVYFSSGFNRVPYKNLVDWWTDNSFGRHLYVGMGAYRVGYKERDTNWANPKEIPNQVRYFRGNETDGAIFFSSRSLKNNSLGFVDSLRQDLFRYPALVPTMPWKDNIPPLSPKSLKATLLLNNALELFWEKPDPASDGDGATYYVIYRFEPDEKASAYDPRRIIGMCHEGEKFVDKTVQPGKRYVYYITSVDRLHNESRPIGPLRVEVQEQKLVRF